MKHSANNITVRVLKPTFLFFSSFTNDQEPLWAGRRRTEGAFVASRTQTHTQWGVTTPTFTTISLEKSLMWRFMLCKNETVRGWGFFSRSNPFFGEVSANSATLQHEWHVSRPQIEARVLSVWLETFKQSVRVPTRPHLYFFSLVAVVIGVYWCSTIYLNMIKKKKRVYNDHLPHVCRLWIYFQW